MNTKHLFSALTRYLTKLLCLTVLLGASTVTWANSGGGGDKGASPFYQMDQVVVNLAPPDVNHYVQINLSIETSDPATVQKLKDYNVILRSRVILIVSSKTMEQVRNLDGRQKLTDELLEMARLTIPANPKDPTNGVSDVHITGFMIQ